MTKASRELELLRHQAQDSIRLYVVTAEPGTLPSWPRRHWYTTWTAGSQNVRETTRLVEQSIKTSRLGAPVNFKGLYLQALSEKDPKAFRELRKNGQLEAEAQRASLEAHELLRQLLAQEPKGSDGLPLDIQAERLAEERVLAQMLDFAAPEEDQLLDHELPDPEPPRLVDIAAESEATEREAATESVYGAANKIFTRSAADAARKRLRKKLGTQLTNEFDPPVTSSNTGEEDHGS
jgi:hypothetical protein